MRKNIYVNAPLYPKLSALLKIVLHENSTYIVERGLISLAIPLNFQ